MKSFHSFISEEKKGASTKKPFTQSKAGSSAPGVYRPELEKSLSQKTSANVAAASDFDTAVGSTIACLGNIGPGIGHVGPVDNFSDIPDFGKWFLSFLMLLGRLELFTVLMILTPHFWKRN